MDAHVQNWLESRTSDAAEWSVDSMLQRKGDTSITVILPALNEEATVGIIVEEIADHLLGTLVDDLVVLDSGSTDDTARVAARAGARVIDRNKVLPEIPILPGKGEAMWRALVETGGDIVVFIDADLRSFNPRYVTGLLGPLLHFPEVQLVKALYERPLVQEERTIPTGGGRVTELVARPLLNLVWPELAGVVQPLAGEYAARRTLLESVPFPTGYGVEFALLVETAREFGIEAIAQVDLGVRVHRHHPEPKLARMAMEIMRAALRRMDIDDAGFGSVLAQFSRTSSGYVATEYPISDTERPPVRDVRQQDG